MGRWVWCGCVGGWVSVFGVDVCVGGVSVFTWISVDMCVEGR